MSRDAAQLLLEARERAGLTQTELARRAGVTQPVLSAYERRRRVPSADALAGILEAAGFRLVLAPGPRRINERVSGERLVQVIELAELLPFKRGRRLEYPPFAGGPQ